MTEALGGTNDSKEPKGLAGWLLLPILGLFVSIFVAFRLFKDGSLILFEPEIWVAFITPGTLFYHSIWVPVIVFGALIQVSMITVSIAALVAIFKKKRFVPRLMIGLYLLGIILAAVDIILGVFFLPALVPELYKQVESESFVKAIGSAVGAAIWIPYFLKSRRVKNTFIR